MRYYFFIFILSVIGLNAQNYPNGYGKEYRFMLLENYASPQKIVFSLNFEEVPATLTIQCVANSFTLNKTIYSKDTQITVLSPIAGTFVNTPNEIVSNRSVRASSNKNFLLQVLNSALYSADIATIIPTENIPNNPEYIINTYRGDNYSVSNSNGSLFGVVAIDDSCLINVMPTAESDFMRKPANVPYKFWLRKGAMYMVKALDSQSFAGTRIWNSNGCKKFAVFEGARCSFVDYTTECKGCDHLYNQSKPIQNLGKEYITIPFTNLSKGYMVQIVAPSNATTVSIDGVAQPIMNASDVLIYNQTSANSLCITSDKNISVNQLMKGGTCNGSNLGNPSMMSVQNASQLANKISFNIPLGGNIGNPSALPTEFYCAIVCPLNSKGSIKLNGTYLDSNLFQTKCNWAIAQLKVLANNSYFLEGKNGFLAYLYANAENESYATELAGGGDNIVTNWQVIPNITQVCDTNYIFKFKATSDSSAIFNWVFGDGQQAIGDSVFKVYNKVGKFNVQLLVSYTNNKACVNDTFSREIVVNRRPYFELGKDTSICEGNVFEIRPFLSSKNKQLWSDNSIAAVYPVHSTQKVWLRVTDSNLCTYSDTIQVNVVSCYTNEFKLPNVFTPNEDNYNNEFEIKMTGFDVANGYIYNRWGELVYHFKYPTDAFWNGGFKNNPNQLCPEGTYYYLIELVNTKTKFSKKLNGVIQLLR